MAKTKRKGSSLAEVLGAICLGTCAAGFIVSIVKAASPKHHCPWCDKVLNIVNAVLLFCPSCKHYFKLS